MPISIPVVLDTESLESQLADLKRKAQETGKAVGDGIGSGAKKAEKSADDAAKGLEDLGDAAGLPVDKLKKLSGGFAALANPATAAVVAVGAVALAGVALATGIVKAVVAAEELSKALAPLRDQKGFGITKEQLASIKGANDAMGAMGAIVKQVVARLGAEFAPVIEKGATLLVKFGLMALDAFNAFADGKDILRELAIFLADKFISSIFGVFDGLANLVGMIGNLARAVGKEELAGKLEGVNAKWNEFTRGLATKAVDYATEGIKRIDAATGDYDARAKKLIGSVRLLDGTTKKLADTYAASVKAIDEDNAMTAKAADLIDSLTSSARKSVADRLSGEAAIKAALEDQLAALEKVYQQAIQTAFTDQQRAEATAAYEQARTEAVLSAEQKIQEAQQKTADDAKKNAQDIADAAQSATVDTIGNLQGGLEGIATLIGGPVAGAIAGLILNLEDSIANIISQLQSLPGIVRAIPSLLTSLVQTLLVDVVPALLLAIPDLVEGLVKAIPTIIRSVIQAIPLIITALIFAIPDIIQAVIFSLPDIVLSLLTLIPLLIAGLMTGFRDAFKFAWDWLLNDGLSSLGKALVQVFKDAWQALQDTLASVFGGDSKKNNDSPSMQRAGPRGTNVGLGAGDYYVAGRNPQSLLEQALDGVFGNAPAPVAASGGGSINLAWQHRAFDGFFVNHASLGGETTEFLRNLRYRDARGM